MRTIIRLSPAGMIKCTVCGEAVTRYAYSASDGAYYYPCGHHWLHTYLALTPEELAVATLMDSDQP